MKISDQERQGFIKILQTSFAEGRLNEYELEERLNTAIGASAIEELNLITRDLPTLSTKNIPITKDSLKCFFSGLERKGNIYIPEHFYIKAAFSGINLDLSEASFAQKTTFIEILAICAGVEIKVPKNANVEVNGKPILAGIFHEGVRENASQNGPIIKINATAILSGVDIKIK